MRKILFDRRGEGMTNTAVKVIIAVVIGALLLGGLYFLVRGDGGILSSVEEEVDEMMGYEASDVQAKRVPDGDSGRYVLQYTLDGTHWFAANLPTYAEGSSAVGIMDNGSADKKIYAALVKEGTNLYHFVVSEDGGATWKEKFNFEAASITHFYYGTSTQLPRGAGSFSGERFVLRWQKSGQSYYTMTSDGSSWKKPTWTDLIPL